VELKTTKGNEPHKTTPGNSILASLKRKGAEEAVFSYNNVSLSLPDGLGWFH
jgi:hypothetical protein